MLAINGMSDHIHIFIGYKPSTSIPDLIKDIKLASGQWINNNRFTKQRFNWQEGYGAFLYSAEHIDTICKYIQNQQLYHQKKTFREEYINFLNEYQIEFEDKYLFEFYNDVYSTPAELKSSLKL